jgi:hypothetical protein
MSIRIHLALAMLGLILQAAQAAPEPDPEVMSTQ